MIDAEIQRRYPQAAINYYDVKADPSLLPEKVEREIEERGLFWPVVVLNDEIKYDGMLTLPKAMAFIEEEQNRLDRLANAQESDWERAE